MLLAREKCKIYRSREEHGVIVAWDLVDLPRDGYPTLLSLCSGMTMGGPQMKADT